MNRAIELVRLCEATKEVPLTKEQDALAWDIADDTGVSYKVACQLITAAINYDNLVGGSKGDLAVKQLAYDWAKNGGKVDTASQQKVTQFLNIQAAKKEREKEDKRRAREEEAEKRDFNRKFPKSKYTDAQYKAICKGAREDWEADNKHDAENGDELGMTMDQVAYDMAYSMIHSDQELTKYIARELQTLNRSRIVDYLADDLVG